MSSSRWVRITALLAAGVLLAALIAPVVAFATVGEPIPGAEIYLEKQPGDDPMPYHPTDPGDHTVNSDFNISWAAGTFSGSGVMTAAVGYSAAGMRATDGALVNTIVSIQYGGPALVKPVTLTFNSPAGSSNPHIYWLNPSTGRFESPTGSTTSGKVTASVGHLSIYGVGGDPVPTSSTPASSPWSLSLLALAGVAIGGIALRSARMHPTTSD